MSKKWFVWPTLWGIVEEPTSPATARCLKYPREMYPHLQQRERGEARGQAPG